MNMLITGDCQRAKAGPGGGKGGRGGGTSGMELMGRLGSEGAYTTDLDMFGFSRQEYIDNFASWAAQN